MASAFKNGTFMVCHSARGNGHGDVTAMYSPAVKTLLAGAAALGWAAHFCRSNQAMLMCVVVFCL